MYTNVNLSAPIGVLGFVGALFCMAVAVLLLFYSLAVGNIFRAGIISLLTALGAGCYFGLVLLFSLASIEHVLAASLEKHFCEIDCHLAYSVVDVNKIKTIVIGNDRTTAQGVFYLITVKTRFDPSTISESRGNSQLTPNSRMLSIVDHQGTKYPGSSEGQKALERSGRGGTPITTPLRPGESYITTFAFDLPTDIQAPRLLITEDDFATRFVIGHENSLLHRKTSFELAPGQAISAN